jgi:hypothetical protein
MMSPTAASGSAEHGTKMLSASARTGAGHFHFQRRGGSLIADEYPIPERSNLRCRRFAYAAGLVEYWNDLVVLAVSS